MYLPWRAGRMEMGARVFRSRAVVLVLVFALACTGITPALAAPQTPQPTGVTAFAAGPIQKFGVVSNVATRYARLGQVSNGACSQLDLVISNQLIAAGAMTYSDSFSFHPYVPKENFDNGLFRKIDLPHLRDLQRANGNKPIRLTELGWSSADPAAGG